MVEAIEAAGYRPGEQCCIALDVAASELRHQNAYILIKERRILSTDELIDMYEEWITKYPIISIEDGMARGRLGTGGLPSWNGSEIGCRS